MLTIKNLSASINGTPILKQIQLDIKPGEVHAVMGPNGSGKSTLSKVIAGDPQYTVTGGEILFQNKTILTLSPEERALNGIFLGFQYPTEIPGVNNANFLRMAYNAKQKHLGLSELDPIEFDQLLSEKIDLLNMEESYLERAVNFGMSGGQKKRNEILQMAVLDPKIAILDETDSGLDIDALRVTAEGINHLLRPDNAVLLITHYQRLLNYIEPNVVHVIADGQIVKSGDKSLALELEAKGYDWIIQ